MMGIPTMPKYVKPAIVTLTSTANSGSTSGETDDLHPIDPVGLRFCRVWSNLLSWTHGLMDWKGYWHMNKGHARRVKPQIHLQYEMLNNDVHQSIFLVMLRLPTSLKPKRCPGVKDCGARSRWKDLKGTRLDRFGGPMEWPCVSVRATKRIRKKDWFVDVCCAEPFFCW